MSGPIRVVIADDHRLLLDGLAQALDGLPDITVVGTAGDGVALLELLERTPVDVLLLDLEMPRLGGVAALRRLPDPPPTIVVTMHTDADHRRRAETAGAVGFLSKSAPLRDLAAAVRAARAGADLLHAEDLEALLDGYRQPRLYPGAEAITGRERELLALLARGITRTEDLADELFISQKTVKNHLASIYEKLGVNDRAQAAVEAIRLGLHRRP
jgi:Response regulator containing a CheY-like receiver domain and an HTH DNA-binding domain